MVASYLQGKDKAEHWGALGRGSVCISLSPGSPDTLFRPLRPWRGCRRATDSAYKYVPQI